MPGGCGDNIKMTLLLVIIACLLREGEGTESQGNSLSFLSSSGFVRVVGYEGSYKLHLDMRVGQAPQCISNVLTLFSR